MKGLTRNVALNREEAEALVALAVKAIGICEDPVDGHDRYHAHGGALKVAEAFGMSKDWRDRLEDLGEGAEADRTAPGRSDCMPGALRRQGDLGTAGEIALEVVARTFIRRYDSDRVAACEAARLAFRLALREIDGERGGGEPGLAIGGIPIPVTIDPTLPPGTVAHELKPEGLRIRKGPALFVPGGMIPTSLDLPLDFAEVTTCNHCGAVVVLRTLLTDAELTECPGCEGELPSVSTKVLVGESYKPGQESGG